MSMPTPTDEQIKEIEEHYKVVWDSLPLKEKEGYYWQYRRLTDPPEIEIITDPKKINRLLIRAFNKPSTDKNDNS
jgi:hypothetical protein